jgi:hypothetical protein
MPNKPNNYRLAYGAVATPSIVRQRLLLALLSEAERLYPRMREQLVQMAMRYSCDGICDFYHLPQELQRYCVQYCQKFGLIHPENPEPIFARIADYLEVPAKPPVPYFMLNCIATTVTRTSCMRAWTGWHLAAGAALIEHETGFEPHKESLAQAKRRTPRRLWPQLRAVIEEAIAGGAQPVRLRWNPRIIELAARAQIGNESWLDIAKLVSRPETPALILEMQADALRKQCTELLRIAGLSKPRGRRAK